MVFRLAGLGQYAGETAQRSVRSCEGMSILLAGMEGLARQTLNQARDSRTSGGTSTASGSLVVVLSVSPKPNQDSARGIKVS